MQMVHRLSGFSPVIGNEPEIVGHAELFGDLPDGVLQPAQESNVFRSRFRKPRYMLFRHDQNMRRRLRVQVLKSGQFLGLVNELSVDLVPGYLTEDAVPHVLVHIVYYF